MGTDTKRWHKALRNAYRGYEYLTETQTVTDDPVLGTIRWQDAISRDRLNIADPYNCILAQLFGDYDSAKELLCFDGTDLQLYYGFNGPFGYVRGEPDCDLLTEAWLYLLKTRG